MCVLERLQEIIGAFNDIPGRTNDGDAAGIPFIENEQETIGATNGVLEPSPESNGRSISLLPAGNDIIQSSPDLLQRGNDGDAGPKRAIGRHRTPAADTAVSAVVRFCASSDRSRTLGRADGGGRSGRRSVARGG